MQPKLFYVIRPIVFPALCTPPHCITPMTSIFPDESHLFNALSNMDASSRRATVYISGPEPYRYKLHAFLATARSNYYLGTLTPLTRHKYIPIATDNVDLSATQYGACPPLSLTIMPKLQYISSLSLSFHAVLSSSAHFGLSLQKPTARDIDTYFPTFVPYPATHALGTSCTPTRLRFSTTKAIHD